MKFKISTKADAVTEPVGGNYMNQSGIYDCTIKFASVAVSKNGAESVNFNIDYNGTPVTLYGPYISDKQGNPLEIGLKLINKLGIIAGMEEGDELHIDEEEHAVGKENKVQTFAVITNFSDLPIKVRVQEEYSVNPKNQETQKSMVIKSFFREDGASAEEIVNGSDIGKRLALETERYASNVTYRDDLTAEMVNEWKKTRVSGAKTSAPTAKTTAKAPTGGLFGQRR